MSPKPQKPKEGAPFGNTHAERYDTVHKRQKLFEKLVSHLSQGFDQKTFPPCAWDTVQRYIGLYPETFNVEQINEAIRQGKLKHEQTLTEISTGKGSAKNGNAAAAIFLAKNKLAMRDRIDVREVPKSNLAEASEEELDEIIRKSQEEIAERNSK